MDILYSSDEEGSLSFMLSKRRVYPMKQDPVTRSASDVWDTFESIHLSPPSVQGWTLKKRSMPGTVWRGKQGEKSETYQFEDLFNLYGAWISMKLHGEFRMFENQDERDATLLSKRLEPLAYMRALVVDVLKGLRGKLEELKTIASKSADPSDRDSVVRWEETCEAIRRILMDQLHGVLNGKRLSYPWANHILARLATSTPTLTDDERRIRNEFASAVRRRYPKAHREQVLLLGRSFALRREMMVSTRLGAEWLAANKAIPSVERRMLVLKAEKDAIRDKVKSTPEMREPEYRELDQYSGLGQDSSSPPAPLSALQLHIDRLLQDAGDKKLEYPPLPSPAPGEKYPQCPYCFHHINIDIPKPELWEDDEPVARIMVCDYSLKPRERDVPLQTMWEHHLDKHLLPYISPFLTDMQQIARYDFAKPSLWQRRRYIVQEKLEGFGKYWWCKFLHPDGDLQDGHCPLCLQEIPDEGDYMWDAMNDHMSHHMGRQYCLLAFAPLPAP
ncbi:hypothetical protein B0I35DRAFT_481940 [Stachybotrys elegans]|uniref:Uncharacterized protein n=1 Tax=Stachybotrys elegans TaxID=80388 RepID=A0A8K0WMK2_9HYPO|nr:hypothetical protein B0I35DRAFT_481940 [Stachybotrys elegans]